MGRLDAVYARLPLMGQHIAVSAFGAYWHWLRFGPGYREALRGYREREHQSAVGWQRYIAQRTAALLRDCVTHVPFYRETWSATERQAALAGILTGVPPTPKEPMRANADAFVREDMRKVRRLVFHTSGSTGTPIASIWTPRELRNSLALREARSMNWAGVSFNRPRATFSGRMVEPDPASTGPFYRFNLVEQQVYFSPFHLRADTAHQYVQALRTHQIEWMTGYAVSYYLLARFILERGLKVPPLRAVVTTSEKLTPAMRATMQQAFKCRIYEEYSTVENAVYASECEAGRLHVSPDAGIVEILRPDGTSCDPGEPGEVVATCLMRNLQPLVRFRLGDMAIWSAEACPCGRAMPVIDEVVGRVEDVVIGEGGRQLVRFHGIFTEQPHVREGQIIQEALDRIRVRIVPTNGFGAADISDIERRMHMRVGTSIAIIVEPVAEIPRSKSGKFQAVISLLRKEGSTLQERTELPDSSQEGAA